MSGRHPSKIEELFEELRGLTTEDTQAMSNERLLLL